MIGVDRGRDVLLDELPTALEHGLAFCRAVYHTSPMGDVVPVQGGLEAGLPDITVVPDLATLTPLPWEPNAAWCLGDAHTTGRRARAGVAAHRGPAGGRRVRRARPQPGLRPRAGVLRLRAGRRTARWQRYANDLGNVYVVGRKGDPQGLLLHMLRQLRDAGLRVTAANHEFSPGQFEINLGHSTCVDAADRSFRLKSAVQEIARHRGLLATFMAKPFNDEGGSGFHVHVSVDDDARPQRLRRPGRARRPVGRGPARDRRRPRPRPGAERAAEPDDQLLQAVRPGHARALADRLGPGQPQRDGPDPAGARARRPDGGPARRRHRQPLPGHGRRRRGGLPGHRATRPSRPPSSRATATTRTGPRCCRSASATRSTRSRPTPTSPTSSASTSSPRSWPTSATRSSGSSASSPTGSSASTPTTCELATCELLLAGHPDTDQARNICISSHRAGYRHFSRGRERFWFQLLAGAAVGLSFQLPVPRPEPGSTASVHRHRGQVSRGTWDQGVTTSPKLTSLTTEPLAGSTKRVSANASQGRPIGRLSSGTKCAVRG